MPTFAPNRGRARRLRELDEQIASAWGAYRDALRGLEGAEYDEAEGEAWDRLQDELADLEQERGELLRLSTLRPPGH